jgi:hypothetical protein
VPPILVEVNHQLESRMREIRQSGSEGGGANPIVSPYPYSDSSSSLGQEPLDHQRGGLRDGGEQ